MSGRMLGASLRTGTTTEINGCPPCGGNSEPWFSAWLMDGGSLNLIRRLGGELKPATHPLDHTKKHPRNV